MKRTTKNVIVACRVLLSANAPKEIRTVYLIICSHRHFFHFIFRCWKKKEKESLRIFLFYHIDESVIFCEQKMVRSIVYTHKYRLAQAKFDDFFFHLLKNERKE